MARTIKTKVNKAFKSYQEIQTRFCDVLESSFLSMEEFFDKVLFSVFGKTPFKRGDSDFIEVDLQMVMLLKASHIKAIRHAGTFDLGGQDLKVFEVIWDTHSCIRRDRLNIQRVIREFGSYYEHAWIVFHDEDPQNCSWQLSYVEKEFLAKDRNSVKRYTYLLGPGYSVLTAAQRLAQLATKNDICIHDIKEAFSVQAVIKEFYIKLYHWYEWAQRPELNVSFPCRDDNIEHNRHKRNEHLIRLITCLIFIWFMKQKNLVSDALFDIHKLKRYLKDFEPNAGNSGAGCHPQCETTTNYYHAILQNLFFALNEKKDRCQCENNCHHIAEQWKDDGTKFLYHDGDLFTEDGRIEILKYFVQTPFLNSDLFECLKPLECLSNHEICTINGDGLSRNNMHYGENIACRAFVPNILFFNEDAQQPGLITLFKQYSFIVDESTSEDITVALDPEVLGNVFENLLASHTPETRETARNATGSFYTPREIVHYMVKTSISGHLKTRIAADQTLKLNPDVIDRLMHEETCPEELLCYRDVIQQMLLDIKILDPACGSGAFPIGIMQCMMEILQKLRPDAENNAYDLKKYIIENCLYGIDIQTIAVQITKLRCFISLIVEEIPDSSKPNFGILTLPNLDARFVVDNALMSLKAQKTTFDASQASSLHFNGIFDDIDGFDIVIGNPPYGASMTEEEKRIYKENYSYLYKRFDIYMVFYELALRLSKNITCYITPDKWLSKTFGLKFRQHVMIPYMSQILHLGNDVFDSALVDAIITVFQAAPCQKLTILQAKTQNNFEIIHEIDKSKIEYPYLIDQYFQQEEPEIITLLEQHRHRLRDFIKCEYASASPTDAYRLKRYIYSHEDPDATELAVINTGLIDKFTNRWHIKAMQYLRDKYSHPVVKIHDLVALFGETYVKKMTSPKLMIKGLNLLDCSIDLEGRMMSTVATLNIRSDVPDLLCAVAAIINSKVMTSYCKAKYLSSSYCGGLLFTPNIIHELPVPDLSHLEDWKDIIDAVKKYMHLGVQKTLLKEIDDMVCAKLMIFQASSIEWNL